MFKLGDVALAVNEVYGLAGFLPHHEQTQYAMRNTLAYAEEHELSGDDLERLAFRVLAGSHKYIDVFGVSPGRLAPHVTKVTASIVLDDWEDYDPATVERAELMASS